MTRFLRLLTLQCNPTGKGRFFQWGGGGGEGMQTLVFFKIEACLVPTAPPSCSYAYVTCTYMLWNQSWKGVNSFYIVLFWSPNHCSIIQLCTYMFLAAVAVFLFSILGICLFVLRLNVPVNNFSVMSGWSHRFLGN